MQQFRVRTQGSQVAELAKTARNKQRRQFA
jgi:hypothetical protein